MSTKESDVALQILNALAPLSRRDEWWSTDGPVAVIECELQRMFPRPVSELYTTYNQQANQQAAANLSYLGRLGST